MLRFWQRLGAFVEIPFDFHAFVCPSRHHAGSGKERVVDGIERDVGVAMLEGDADDYDVVNMVQVLSDSLLADMRLYAPYDDVSSRS